MGPRDGADPPRSPTGGQHEGKFSASRMATLPLDPPELSMPASTNNRIHARGSGRRGGWLTLSASGSVAWPSGTGGVAGEQRETGALWPRYPCRPCASCNQVHTSRRVRMDGTERQDNVSSVKPTRVPGTTTSRWETRHCQPLSKVITRDIKWGTEQNPTTWSHSSTLQEWDHVSCSSGSQAAILLVDSGSVEPDHTHPKTGVTQPHDVRHGQGTSSSVVPGPTLPQLEHVRPHSCTPRGATH